jgi:AraC family transcriptional regulator
VQDVALIDFVADEHPPSATLLGRLANAGAIISRYLFDPNPTGARLASSQFMVIMHEGEPFDMELRGPEDRTFSRHHVEAGQFHIIPPHTPIDVAWEERPQATVIAYGAAVMNGIAEEHFDGSLPRLHPQIAAHDEIVQHLCATLGGKIGRKGRYIALCAETIALQLILHVFSTFGVGVKTAPTIKGGLTMAQQRRVLAYIESHLSKDIALVELSEQAGLSQRHFLRAFKQTFGETPCRYARASVMREAQTKLLNTRKSVTEIALDLGFENFGNFSTAFRKHTGMAPDEYRRKHS